MLRSSVFARALLVAGVLAAVACGPRAGAAPSAPTRAVGSEVLRFDITEGKIENHFYRRGPVAAHVLVTSGREPRLLVAFPAGDAGVAVWFEELAAPTRFALDGALEPVERPDGMRGVTGRLVSDAPGLRARRAVLGSIRIIARAGHGEPPPPEAAHEVRPGPPVVLRRTTGCGTHMELALEGENGTRVEVDGGGPRVSPGADGAIHLRFAAAQDEAPLHPIASDELLAVADDDLRALQALAFLSYSEKLLAGSWRFLTYFGRDTLLAIRLLLPGARPTVIEAGLSAVLERLAPDGQVAHEEGIGDFAALASKYGTCAAQYDYKMIDDDFMLAPIAAQFLLDTEGGRAGAAAFLARRTAAGITFADALRRNLEYVLVRSAAFAEKPEPRNLISLQAGQAVGNWRDSDDGLAGGRFPYDVNVALVPAALEAAARLYASPLLGAGADQVAARARRFAQAWQAAAPLFQVRVPAATARLQAEAYARAQGLPQTVPPAAEAPLAYPAIALDAEGHPIPVMHSDEGFVLLFRQPPATALDEVADLLLRPFPTGLMTPVGMVVANPAFAGAKIQDKLTRGAYHGTVVWSWQQAMMAAGLARQLARTDLPDATRAHLAQAQRALWAAIRATAAQRTGELWSWDVREGRIVLVPYGQGVAHDDESNAAQLWSTVFLAIPPPAK